MSSEEKVLTALKALREADRGMAAPASVETALLDAFGERRAVRRVSVWLAAAAFAAGVVSVVIVRVNHQPRQTVVVRSEPVIQQVVSVQPLVETPRRLEVIRPQAPRRVVQPVPQREIVTEFFPLMDAAPPLGRGELVRMAVPASAMRSVGLPVREERLGERVQADLLIGEEGMPRAIRFVTFQ